AVVLTPQLLSTVDYYHGVLGNEAAARGAGLWAPLTLSSPFDVIFLVVAVPLLVPAVRSRPRIWGLVALAGLAVGTVHTIRFAVWLLLFAATPAANRLSRSGIGQVTIAPRVAAISCGMLAVLIGLALASKPLDEGKRLREDAAREAGHSPILADSLNAE